MIGDIEELTGGDQDRIDAILANFNQGEIDDLIMEGDTPVIGRNCSGSDSYGPICEDYFYPRQNATGGVFNADPENLIIFNNFNSLFDGIPYDEATITVRINRPTRGTVRPLSGEEFVVTIGDPQNIAPDEEDPICQGNPDDPPSCDRFGGGRDGDEETDDENKICEQAIKVTGGWLICAIIDFVDDRTEQWIDKVDELLSVGGDEYNTDEMRKAWSYFRNIASLLLMAIGLVMIIGQGISKE